MEKFKRVLKRVCVLVFAFVIALPLVACGKANVKGEAFYSIKKEAMADYISSTLTKTKMTSYTLKYKGYSYEKLVGNFEVNVLAYGNKVEGDGFLYMDDSLSFGCKFTFDSTHIEWWDYESVLITSSKNSYNYDMVGLFNGKTVSFPTTDTTLTSTLYSQVKTIIQGISTCSEMSDCSGCISNDEDEEYEVTTYYKSYENRNKYKINYKYTPSITTSSSIPTIETNYIFEFDNNNCFSKGIYIYESSTTTSNYRNEYSIIRNGYKTA